MPKLQEFANTFRMSSKGNHSCRNLHKVEQTDANMPQVAFNGRRVWAAFIILGQLKSFFVKFDDFYLLLTFGATFHLFIF